MNASHEKFGGSPWAASFNFNGAQTTTIKLCPPPGSRIPVGAALHSGAAEAGTTTTLQDTALTQTQTDYWRNKLVKFTSGANNNAVRLITAFNAGTDTITFTPAVGTAVGAADTFELYTADSSNRLVVTGYTIQGFNTAGAVAPVIIRNHATTTAALLRFTIPVTTGHFYVSEGDAWLPLIADETLQYNCNAITGEVNVTMWGRILQSSFPNMDKYTMDA